MPLELYKPQGPRRTKEATVTIQKDKTFSLNLNRSAWEAIGEPQHVHLLFDPDERLVVIRPAEETSLAAMNVKKYVDRYFRISASGFINHYAIPYDPSRRYHVETTVTDDGLQISFNLTEQPDWISQNQT
jgi:hypothetical protein